MDSPPPHVPLRCEPACPPYEDLTERSDVLVNLERAMSERDVTHYVELLDPDEFAFLFWDDNYGHADVILPESWGRDEEMVAAETLLNRGDGVYGDPVLSVDIILHDGNSPWEEFDPDGHPGWFRTTVRYSFLVETKNETAFITEDPEMAEFTIRQREVDGKMIWGIVEWADYPAGSPSLDAMPAGTETISWSVLKAMYAPPPK